MKKIVLLCLLSASLGAVVSVTWNGFSARDREAAAQVPAPGAYPGPAPQPDPGASPGIASPFATRSQAGLPAPSPVGLDELTPEEQVNIAVYEAANRSVVNVTTSGYQGDRIFFVPVPSQGEGSGAVIDKQGHIVTNSHVVEGADEIQVTLFNGKSYSARRVGADRNTDVAVVKIDAPADELYPVALGDSNRLRVGQRVFALGNPFGLERTLSTGIVSSLDRWIPSRNGRKIRQIIQIDAAINPGSSGGPLLDSRARMIGMNTAIASKTGESAGVGFAIPASTIARIVPQLVKNGRVIRPDAGILRVAETEQGLLVATVAPGGPAERAGLQGPRVVHREKRQGPFIYHYQTIDPSSADLIVSVDGQPIKTRDDFLSAVEAKRPGEQVVLGIVRNGREVSVPLRLDAGE